MGSKLSAAGTVSRESLPKSAEAGWSLCSLFSEWHPPPLASLLKADRLGKMPKPVACGCAWSHSSAHVDYSHGPTHPSLRSWDFKREFLSAGSKHSAGREGAWLMLNRFIGRQGKPSIDHRVAVLSASLCTLFWVSRLVSPLPLPLSP